MTATVVVPEGAACIPNLSPGARHLRVRIARLVAVVAVVALGAASALGTAWWVRVLVFFPPTLVAAIAFFEARSSVCVVAAAQGVYEDDGRAKTPMDSALLPAVRRVALSLTGKSILVAVAASLAAALTALVH